ncbi:MAG: universal stress protein [Trueperaceae bacterium]
MTPSAAPEIRRILVALDASADSAAALEAAVALAARLEAELLGLFVEDVDLLRAAGLPFAREIRVFQLQPRQIRVDELEAQLLARARAIERALAHAADRSGVRFTFRRVRGSVAAEVMAATGDADLVVVGRAGHAPARRGRLGSTALALVVQGSRPVLVLGRRLRLRDPVFAVYDGSAGARHALAVALRLTPPGQTVHVVVTGDDEDAVQERWADARALVGDGGAPMALHAALRADATELARVARTEGAGVVVAPATSPLFESGALVNALDDAGCPLLAVR